MNVDFDLPQLQQLAVGMVHAALQKLKAEPINEDILAVIKKEIDNRWKNSLGNVESLGSQLTEAAMGNISDIWQRHDVLKSVTVADVQRVATYLFHDERMTMGIISRRKVLSSSVLEDCSELCNAVDDCAKVRRAKESADWWLPNEGLELFKPLEERELQEKDFGLPPHCPSAADRVHLLITAKSNTQKSALSKVAARLIKEGFQS